QGVEPAAGSEVNTLVLSLLPVINSTVISMETAILERVTLGRIKRPNHTSCGSIERGNLRKQCRNIGYPVDDDRRTFYGCPSGCTSPAISNLTSLRPFTQLR